MTVMVCLDDNNGMMFNGRRQSRDREVIRDMLQTSGEGRLYMNEYSAGLFREAEGRYCVSDDPLREAGEGDFCFVENLPLSPYEDRIGGVVVYRWNRVYPADAALDLALEPGYRLVDRTEFPGFSHETVTKEVYRK